jgi:hypothetical protein
MPMPAFLAAAFGFGPAGRETVIIGAFIAASSEASKSPAS